MMSTKPLQGDQCHTIDNTSFIKHLEGLVHIDREHADVFAFALEAMDAAGVGGVDAAQEDEHGLG